MKTSQKTANGFSALVQSVLPGLAELGVSQESPAKFFEKLVDELYSALELTAAAVWMLDDPNTFRLLFDRDFKQLWNATDRITAQQNQSLLCDIIQNPEPITRPFLVPQVPNSNAVLLLPIIRHDECVAIVQLFGDEHRLLNESVDDRLAIQEIQAIVNRYLERMEAVELTGDPAVYLKRFQGFCKRLHQSLDPRQVAGTAVNDSTDLLQSDRVCLLMRYGNRWKLKTVSGRSSINRRSNQVRQLESLTRKAMLASQPLLYQGTDKGLPPQLTEPLALYLEQSGARMMLISPLVVPSETHDETKNRPARRVRPNSALVFEQFQDSQPNPNLLAHSNEVCTQVALALANAQAHHRIPMLGLLTMVGSCVAWFRGRRLALSIVAVVLFVGLFTALIDTRAEYRVEGRGRLMPVVQRRVFAPMQGEVVDILVESGEKVQAGQPLIQLRNDDLVAQLLSVKNQLSQKMKELHAANVELHAAARTSSRDRLLRLQAGQEKAQIDIDGLKEQIAHLTRQVDSLTLRSPIDGIMTTFRPAQDLQGRPIQRGDVLLEVFNGSGEWRLEIDVPQSRMGHVLDARERAGDEALKVSFQLESNPGETFEGRLVKIVDQTSVRSETAGMVRMMIELDDNSMHPKRIGSDVSVKLNCGQRSLLYVLFGDVLEFGQRQFWF